MRHAVTHYPLKSKTIYLRIYRDQQSVRTPMVERLSIRLVETRRAMRNAAREGKRDVWQRMYQSYRQIKLELDQ